MKYLIIGLLCVIVTHCFAQDSANMVRKGDSLLLVYGDTVIFAGRVQTSGTPYVLRQQTQKVKGCTWQIITIRTDNGKTFRLDGRVRGSDESIACESDPADARTSLVRQVVGRSHSLLNNAVYERSKDWLFSVDNYASTVKIVPVNRSDYDIAVSGWEIVIRFRPRYFREHRGLSYFEPSAYTVWKKPVVGWCSWFAYFDGVNEKEIKETADVIGAKLKPYGLQYLQIDDGYTQHPIGLPDTWLHPNAKFPSGLKELASYISGKGLTPGIWTNVSFGDSAAAYGNRGLFVRDGDGRPASGNWIGYVMDGSHAETLQKLVSPVYKGLYDDGFRYFKLDALRHLKYEGYNSFSEFFTQRRTDRNDAFRSLVKEVRRQVGREQFLLACWGIRPELVGIADGCRIGTDGFSFAGLAQFNSYNNIIWRNDPDHIVLSAKEAYRSCSATSLTGSLFMLTDKAEFYRNSPLIEAARRTIPVLYTQPGQVYDVDPSRSSRIAGADVEMSGSGPRPFDAGSQTSTGLFQLEINRPFGNWVVLGRLDERDRDLPFRDLGLDDTREYLVFEFWSKQFRGVFRSHFVPGPIDTAFNCQAFCIREKLDHPQLLATYRHISCGGLEIGSMSWTDNTLQGTSELVAGDNYVLYLWEDGGYAFDKLEVKGARVLANEKTGTVRKITLLSAGGGVAEWDLHYSPVRVSLITALKQFSISSLPEYRVGTVVRQESTYDRTGGNDDGFNGTWSFVRRNPDSTLVLLDVDGPGEIDRFATPTPTKDTLDFYIDDRDKPALTLAYTDLFSGKVYPFISPLSGSGAGGYYSYFPILFQRHCRIVSRGKKEQFHQIQYRLFPAGTQVESFSDSLSANENAALAKMQREWSLSPQRRLQDLRGRPVVYRGTIRPQQETVCFDTHRGGRLVGLELRTDRDLTEDCKYLKLRVTWDGDELPAIDCPVAAFFGFGFGRPSMRGLLIGSDGVRTYSFLPMPFDHRATIELINDAPGNSTSRPISFTLTTWVDSARLHPATEGRFYSQYRQDSTIDGQPWPIARISGRGHYIGTVLSGQGTKAGVPLFWEGDDSTVVDGQSTIHGTGTEDYFNGGWYALKGRWDSARSFPLSGCLDYSTPLGRTGGYRFYLNDKLPFDRQLLQTIEHGPQGNHIPAVYTSVAYYYADRPGR